MVLSRRTGLEGDGGCRGRMGPPGTDACACVVGRVVVVDGGSESVLVIWGVRGLACVQCAVLDGGLGLSYSTPCLFSRPPVIGLADDAMHSGPSQGSGWLPCLCVCVFVVVACVRLSCVCVAGRTLIEPTACTGIARCPRWGGHGSCFRTTWPQAHEHRSREKEKQCAVCVC